MTISKKELEILRSTYPNGTRVALLDMDDPQAPPSGTCGTVYGVDDIGSILVKWDNGSTLNLIYKQDSFRKLS